VAAAGCAEPRARCGGFIGQPRGLVVRARDVTQQGRLGLVPRLNPSLARGGRRAQQAGATCHQERRERRELDAGGLAGPGHAVEKKRKGQLGWAMREEGREGQARLGWAAWRKKKKEREDGPGKEEKKREGKRNAFKCI
jgi:hypothetical protein